jgi:hypothetical protein
LKPNILEPLPPLPKELSELPFLTSITIKKI